MKIEKVEWSTYNLSFEDLIESWSVAADIEAVLRSVIRTRAASKEEIDKAENR